MAFRIVNDDVIQQILSNYMEHRNYKVTDDDDDIERKPMEPQDETPDKNVLPANDWFLDGALSAFQSIRNVATLRLKEEDFVKEIETAFRRFVEFINEVRIAQEKILPSSSSSSSSSTPNDRKTFQHAEELFMTCFPLFVHIFIQLFECGHVTNAQNFFIEHYHRFTKKPNHLQFLSSMQAALNDNVLNQTLQNFKNFKCRIMISEETFKLLTVFLKDERHMSILQIFNSCLDFRVMTQEEYINQLSYQKPKNIPSDNQTNVNDELNLLERNLSNPQNSSKMNEIMNLINSAQNLNDESDLYFPTKAYQTIVCLMKMKSKNISSVAISKDLSKIFVGNENSEIILWDCDLTDDLQYYSTRAYKHWNRIPVKYVSSEIDFKFINAKRFSAQSKKTEEDEEEEDNDNFDFSKVKENVEPIKFRGHSDTVYEMSYLFNSKLLLSCSGDTTIRLWDVNSASSLATYKGHTNAIWTIDSNDSGCFISGGKDGIAFMWDVERTIPLRIYPGHLMDINQIKFHPNCNYLATASADKTIILWDVNQVRQVRMFCGHQTSINSLRFSSCGKYLASASEDGSIKIWDISQGKCLGDMIDHQDNIRCIAFGTNDHLLASCGSESSLIYIWEDPIKCVRNQQSRKCISMDINISNDIIKDHPDQQQPQQQQFMHLQFIRHNVLLAFSKNRNSI